eukprot:TRINITY_DN18106_c0_g1_i1.p1 TRINITY_DN18106_c0_g1~~TRINITY_DN18106_c0_g1_i1.p1  ORF type:complete len:416 (+),score=69.26 TRINITY_DN18106_c0_g1_i1:67-1248(+)
MGGKRGRSGTAGSRNKHKRKKDESEPSRSVSSNTSERKRKKRNKTHYSGGPGSELDDGRYKVLRKLGEGTFSKVMECVDEKKKTRVAVKIIRAEKRYMLGAEEELGILRLLEESSTEKHIININRTFLEDKKGCDARHTCIVLPLYGPSVFHVLENNKFKGYSKYFVKSIAYQLVSCMEFSHSKGVIHTDIKPENVIFKHSDMLEEHGGVLTPISPEIIVIDFGSAHNVHNKDVKKKTTIGTRHYRAPEAVLELGWSYPSDIWAIGTMLVELGFGECMFSTHNSLEHLAMMEHVLGDLPRGMVTDYRRRTSDDPCLLSSSGRVNWPLSSTKSSEVDFVRELPRLTEQTRCMDDKQWQRNEFHHFIRGMLEYIPEERMTCREALRHNYLKTTTL